MKNKLKVSLAYNSYPDAVLDELTTAIVAAMTGNVAFPAPTIPPFTVTTRQTAFRNALAAAAPVTATGATRVRTSQPDATTLHLSCGHPLHRMGEGRTKPERAIAPAV
jgi:hypothetical protein